MCAHACAQGPCTPVSSCLTVTRGNPLASGLSSPLCNGERPGLQLGPGRKVWRAGWGCGYEVGTQLEPGRLVPKVQGWLPREEDKLSPGALPGPGAGGRERPPSHQGRESSPRRSHGHLRVRRLSHINLQGNAACNPLQETGLQVQAGCAKGPSTRGLEHSRGTTQRVSPMQHLQHCVRNPESAGPQGRPGPTSALLAGRRSSRVFAWSSQPCRGCVKSTSQALTPGGSPQQSHGPPPPPRG